MSENDGESGATKKSETRILVALLLINLVMFAAEAVFGWLSRSAGLIADSIDMLADAFVYLISKEFQLICHAGMDCWHPGHMDVIGPHRPWP
ncbi:MAG: cation transporter, partial [Pseudomonadota bacterium]